MVVDKCGSIQDDQSISAYGIARATIQGTPLAPDELRKTDAYWQASPYLCLGMLYLRSNPLLRTALTARRQLPWPVVLPHRVMLPWANCRYPIFLCNRSDNIRPVLLRILRVRQRSKNHRFCLFCAPFFDTALQGAQLSCAVVSIWNQVCQPYQ